MFLVETFLLAIMPLHYTLDSVDTQDYRCVAFAIIQTFHEAYPNDNSFYIPRLLGDVNNMFAGKFENLQPIDIHYHDLEHTLQAALCLTRIIVSRQLTEASYDISAEEFKLALVAVTFHDSGYLKSISDREGTGAKYIRIHEQRSCQNVARYLQRFDWDAGRIESVQNMIRCTGLYADTLSVKFRKPIDRLLGQAVCTADYIGQMSDQHYVGKLYHLYEEFEESDKYYGVSQKERSYSSFQDILLKTPHFWENVVQPKLYIECGNMFKYLRRVDGSNPYFDAIEENINEIRNIIQNPELISKHSRKNAIR